MKNNEGQSSSYQVVVRGELRPAVRAFCTRSPTYDEISGVFQLRVHDGQGVADLVATLQAAGLTILSIRQVTRAEKSVPARLPA